MANKDASPLSLKPNLAVITTEQIFGLDACDNGRREPETPDLSPSQTVPPPTALGGPLGPPNPEDSQGPSDQLEPTKFCPDEVDRHRNWKSPILMLAFWLVGVACSFAHCIFYASLGGTIVGAPWQQETNLRLGTAFAFISQISLTASVWQTHTQWIWRCLAKVTLRMATLNDIFSADTSILWVRNFAMFKKFTVGYLIALYAWYVTHLPALTER